MVNQTLIQRRPVREVNNTSSLTIAEFDKYKRIYSTHTSGINYILTEDRFKKEDVLQLFSIGGGTLLGTNITFVGGTTIPANSAVELVCVAANVFTVEISGVGSSSVAWGDITDKPTSFKPIDPVYIAEPTQSNAENVLVDRTTGRIFGQVNTTNNFSVYRIFSAVAGSWVLWKINAPSEPDVLYASSSNAVPKLPCPDFLPNTDMYMYIFSLANGAAQYFFLEK